MRNIKDFKKGPIIVEPLIRLSLPFLASLFLQALYGTVDLWVAEKYAAMADVFGVAVCLQVVISKCNVGISISSCPKITKSKKCFITTEVY